ncbi:hypothetical protein T484DRAFT_1944171 [Baffinella frigidus]|nr:hypothetical protein T484DRAFT_1944171 [Cryptophyta sp. CCMP2293]
MREDGLLDYSDERMMGKDRLAEAARRKKTVLRTGVATLSAVCVLACVRPASAFDGGSLTLISEEASALVAPAPPKVAKKKESKADMKFRVAAQAYKKTTRQDLMAMSVKVKCNTHMGRSKGEHVRDFVLWTLFCASSLMMVPWYTFRRERDLLAAPHLKRRIW